MKTVFTYGLLFLLAPAIVFAQYDDNNQFGYNEAEADIHFAIPEMALMDIEPIGISNIKLSLSPSSVPGEPVSVKHGTNDKLWINYTSSLATGSNTRSIDVHIADGQLPPGIQLALRADAYKGSGEGSFGSPTGEIILSTVPQKIISGIGRCYTGNGNNRGHQLTFSMSISDMEGLEFDEDLVLQIAYTITDN